MKGRKRRRKVGRRKEEEGRNWKKGRKGRREVGGNKEKTKHGKEEKRERMQEENRKRRAVLMDGGREGGKAVKGGRTFLM